MTPPNAGCFGTAASPASPTSLRGSHEFNPGRVAARLDGPHDERGAVLVTEPARGSAARDWSEEVVRQPIRPTDAALVPSFSPL
ncbi:MAG TPA: hypothetical protein VL242_06475 [Sorangium sp.]|nr:hypothetical protein [Sorangium sp.]